LVEEAWNREFAVGESIHSDVPVFSGGGRRSAADKYFRIVIEVRGVSQPRGGLLPVGRRISGGEAARTFRAEEGGARRGAWRVTSGQIFCGGKSQGVDGDAPRRRRFTLALRLG